MVKINSQPNFLILKEPRGFIKLIEVFIAIFAFATICGYAGFFRMKMKCHFDESRSQNVLMAISYPFVEDNYFVDDDYRCNNTRLKGQGIWQLSESYQSESQFFVFVGVISFLYSLAIVAVYVFVEDQDQEASSTNVGKCSIPVVDFVFSAVLVFFWFVSSCAWASGFTGVREATTLDYLKTILPECNINVCTLTQKATFGALYVSVIIGFLNVFVWIGNLWFLFKETPWHSPRRSASGIGGPPAGEQPFTPQQVPEAPSAAI